VTDATLIPVWEWVVLGLLALHYSFLALFRAAQLELPRVKLGSVLREAGRTGGLLERWLPHEQRTLLLLAVQIAFQAILILVTLVVADMVEREFPMWSAPLRYGVAFAGTVIVLAFLVRFLIVRMIVHLVPEKAVRLGGQVAAGTALLLLPVLVPADRLIRRMSARMESRVEEKSEEFMEEEVHAFVSMGEEEGILEKEEGDLVRNVVDFGDTIVREIMTPRTDMVVLNFEARLGEVRKAFVAAKHSRIPVQRENADHIEGVLTIKDLLPFWGESSQTEVGHLIRPVMFVPETKKILDLLREMQRAQVPFAIVVDEYGGTAGLVTVEDIVEEIVGEIQDEHETAEADMVEESPGTWLVSGFADVDEIADLLGLDVIGTDVDTAGGLLASLLGRVPEVGESLEHEGVRMEVVSADERRVLKIRMTRVKARVPLEEKT
jgi:CBS domain containing-hemolysin-like protein